jgi:hypothetical protein
MFVLATALIALRTNNSRGDTSQPVPVPAKQPESGDLDARDVRA